VDVLNTILQIPERCLVNKKITKAFFKRNFDLTSTEKFLLDDFNAVVTIEWLATIGPANANIARYQDEQIIFEEVQVISVQTAELDFDRNQMRIAELVQKYIPYPILLCIWHNNAFLLNTCDKKLNRNDITKRTIEKRYSTGIIKKENASDQKQAFLQSLAYSALDKTNLKTYYDSYTQRIIALQTSELSGLFVPRTQSRTKSDMDNLEKIEVLQKGILALQNQAIKESQLNQRVALNTQIQEKRKQIELLKALLTV
jgi:hypothetical protein